MAIKTKDVDHDAYRFYYNTSSEGKPERGSPSVEGGIFTTTDYREDEGPVSSYRLKISRVEDATSFLTGTKWHVGVRRGSAFEVWQYPRVPHPSVLTMYGYSERSGDISELSAPYNVGSPSLSDADDQAIIQFIRKSRSAQSQLQAGVVLGEIRETLEMIHHPAKALRRGLDDYLSSVKKRRRGTPKQKRRALSESWLEYSFGWTPLLSDVRSGAEALASILHRVDPHQEVRAVGSSKAQVDSEYSKVVNQGSYRIGLVNSEEYVVVYRGAVKIPINDRVLMTRTSLGLRLDDFVPTLWELIPYSFLVDYFTNIGDVLSSWSYFESNFAWKSKTEVHSLKGIRNVKDFSIPQEAIDSPFQLLLDSGFSPGSSVVEKRTVTRQRHIGPLIPNFRMEIPGMTSLKWLNLAALGRTHQRLLPF